MVRIWLCLLHGFHLRVSIQFFPNGLWFHTRGRRVLIFLLKVSSVYTKHFIFYIALHSRFSKLHAHSQAQLEFEPNCVYYEKKNVVKANEAREKGKSKNLGLFSSNNENITYFRMFINTSHHAPSLLPSPSA